MLGFGERLAKTAIAFVGLIAVCFAFAVEPGAAPSISDYSIFGDTLPSVLKTRYCRVEPSLYNDYFPGSTLSAIAGVWSSVTNTEEHPRYILSEFGGLDLGVDYSPYWYFGDSAHLRLSAHPRGAVSGRWYPAKLPFLEAGLSAEVPIYYTEAEKLNWNRWGPPLLIPRLGLGAGRTHEISKWVIAKRIEKLLLVDGTIRGKLTPEDIDYLMSIVHGLHDTRGKVELIDAWLNRREGKRLTLRQGLDISDFIDKNMYPYTVGAEVDLSIARQVLSIDSVVQPWFEYRADFIWNHPLTVTRLLELGAWVLVKEPDYTLNVHAQVRHLSSPNNEHSVTWDQVFSEWTMGCELQLNHDTTETWGSLRPIVELDLFPRNRSSLEISLQPFVGVRLDSLGWNAGYSLRARYKVNLF